MIGLIGQLIEMEKVADKALGGDAGDFARRHTSGGSGFESPVGFLAVPHTSGKKGDLKNSTKKD